MSDVLIIIGPSSTPARKADLAAVGFGQRAASLSGGAVDLLVLGPAADKAARGDLGNLGARVVYTLNHDDLDPFTAEAATAAVAEFLQDRSYRLLGAPTSSSSKEYFPRLAARLKCPLASDILSLDSLSTTTALCTRAVYSGNLLASVELTGPLALTTCRAAEFEVPPSSDIASTIEAVTIAGPLAHERKKFISRSRAESRRPDLAEAEIVISAGRGTGGPEKGIPLVEELADILGAAVGSTRAVVDAGWLPNEFQVGQTGKIVAPDLYIAVGLSGAIQHLAGMRNSKAIVAINKDENAPIFEVADFGLVADLFEVLPDLIAGIQKIKAD